MTDRDAYVQGLRDLADWVEAHPAAPVPPNDHLLVPLHTNAAVHEVAHELGVEEEYDSEGNASFNLEFGQVVYRVYGYEDFVEHCARSDERRAHEWADKNGMSLRPAKELPEGGEAS